MTCERCNGLMASERICDLQGTGDLCVDGYRCLNCGNPVDSTILENRQPSIDAVKPFRRIKQRIPQPVAA
jgi:hypothetical protein